MLIDTRPITYWDKATPGSNRFIIGIQLRNIRFSDTFRVWRGKAFYEEASIGIISPLDEQIIECRWETEMEAERVCL